MTDELHYHSRQEKIKGRKSTFRWGGYFLQVGTQRDGFNQPQADFQPPTQKGSPLSLEHVAGEEMPVLAGRLAAWGWTLQGPTSMPGWGRSRCPCSFWDPCKVWHHCPSESPWRFCISRSSEGCLGQQSVTLPKMKLLDIPHKLSVFVV